MAEIHVLTSPTTLDLPLERILNGAKEAELSMAVVVGYTPNGKFYISGTMADAQTVAYLLSRGIHQMHQLRDEVEAE